MKKLCLLSLIFILGIWGCSSNSVGPITDTEQNLNGEGLSEISSQTLHKKQGNKTDLTVTGLIKSKKSSELIMDSSYKLDSGKKGHGKHGKKVEVYAKIKFPAGAVDKDETITMTFDPATEVFTFSPAMVFNKDAKLEVKLKGLDLKGVKKGDVEFVYLRLDGTEVFVKHSNIGINKKKGELKVANLKIRHFSRFGFTF